MVKLSHSFSIVICVAIMFGAVVKADPILGTWQVEPDHKGQIGQVVIRSCSEAFCGRVVRVVDKTGKSVVTRSMG